MYVGLLKGFRASEGFQVCTTGFKNLVLELCEILELLSVGFSNPTD